MAEQVLEAEIDLATHEAFNSLQAFLGRLEATDVSLANVARNITVLEQQTGQLATANRVVSESAQQEQIYIERVGESYRLSGISARQSAEQKVQSEREATQAAEQSATRRESASARAARQLQNEILSARNMTDAYAGVGGAAATAGRETNVLNQLGSSAIGIVANWQGAVAGLVASYLGFNGIVDILQKMNDAQRDLINTQQSLVQSRLGFSEQLRDIAFNLNLPTTTGGQQQARQILEQFMREAPGADMRMIQSVLGQMTAFNSVFQSPVTQPGTGREIAADVANMSARLGLEPQTAGDVVRLLATQQARDPRQARQILAELEQAARTSPIESPRDFMQAALRTTLPLMQQGLGFRESFGMFSAAAGPEPSALRASTNVEQFSRLFIGRDDKSMAELFRRSVDVGLLDSRQFAEKEAEIRRAVMPDYDARLRNANQTILDAQQDSETNRVRFEREMAELEQKRRRAGGDVNRASSIANDIAARQEGYERSQRENQQRAERAQDTIVGLDRDINQKVNERLGAAAWRSMSLARRFEVFQRLAEQAKTPARFEELIVSLGATREEAQAATGVMLGAGPAALRATTEAMAGADTGQFTEANREYQRLDIAQQTAAQNQQLLRTSGAATDPVIATFRLSQQSRTRAQQLESAMGGRPPMQSEQLFRLNVLLDDVINQIQVWYSTTTDAERQAMPEIDQFVTEARTFMRDWPGMTGNLDVREGRLHRLFQRFFELATRVSQWRGAHPGIPRTTNMPRVETYNFERSVWNQYQQQAPFVEPMFPNADIDLPRGGPTTRPTTQPTAGQVSSAGNAAAAFEAGGDTGGMIVEPIASAGRSGPGIVYNVNIGTVVANNGDALDAIGRLEASERA